MLTEISQVEALQKKVIKLEKAFKKSEKKKTTNIQIKENFNYLVVSTGYTSRLLEGINDLEAEIKDVLDFNCKCDFNDTLDDIHQQLI